MDGTQSQPVPEQIPSSPEVGAEQLLSDALEAKVAPVAAEAASGQVGRDDGVAQATAQVATIAADDQGAGQTTTPTAAAAPAPLVAEDVDVIEPEWVKRAEEAVAANREDPHAEEVAVEAIQIEYLKKRYDIDVKPGDEKP
jgi:hypothetical protein